jgi:hypothetical protein
MKITRVNAGGSQKLSAVSAGHIMQVKERHYEKVGEDFEQGARELQKVASSFCGMVVEEARKVIFFWIGWE